MAARRLAPIRLIGRKLSIPEQPRIEIAELGCGGDFHGEFGSEGGQVIGFNEEPMQRREIFRDFGQRRYSLQISFIKTGGGGKSLKQPYMGMLASSTSEFRV